MREWLRILVLSALVAFAGSAFAKHDPKDTHYVGAGFFDIHVCIWPDRPQFFLVIFSTTHFNELASVEAFRPDGSPIGSLGFDKYRLVQGKHEKRVFMRQFPTRPSDRDGWYTARITMKDGRRFVAKDYVRVASSPIATGLTPSDAAELASVPKTLAWKPVPGAHFYQVFIRDIWDGDAKPFSSKMLSKPEFKVPAGLLHSGDVYAWRVHAADVNGDVKLGDFNSGSLGPEIQFSIK